MTLAEALRRGIRTLSHLEDARLECELLLCWASSLPRHRLRLDPGLGLTRPAERRFLSALSRRAARVPLQHITGETEFCGRRFLCGPGAMVPRPETEILVERVLELAPPGTPLLDVGTGTGVIALTVALERPGCRVIASDASREALALAARNAGMHGVRLPMVLGDLLEPFSPGGRLGCIVANLPYVRSDELETLQPEVRDGDPRAALDGGRDGLDQVRRLVAQAPARLGPEGLLAMELDPLQTGEVARQLESSGWLDVRIHPDLTSRPRHLTARKPTPGFPCLI